MRLDVQALYISEGSITSQHEPFTDRIFNPLSKFGWNKCIVVFVSPQNCVETIRNDLLKQTNNEKSCFSKKVDLESHFMKKNVEHNACNMGGELTIFSDVIEKKFKRK